MDLNSINRIKHKILDQRTQERTYSLKDQLTGPNLKYDYRMGNPSREKRALFFQKKEYKNRLNEARNFNVVLGNRFIHNLKLIDSFKKRKMNIEKIKENYRLGSFSGISNNNSQITEKIDSKKNLVKQRRKSSSYCSWKNEENKEKNPIFEDFYGSEFRQTKQIILVDNKKETSLSQMQDINEGNLDKEDNLSSKEESTKISNFQNFEIAIYDERRARSYHKRRKRVPKI